MEEKRIKAIENKAKRGLFDYLSGKTNNKILIVIRDKNAAALNDILKDEKQDITKAVDKKNTALHYSLKKEKSKNNRYYIRKSPDFINAQNDKGETALHIVSYEGKIDIVKRLLAKDADVSKKDKEGNTNLLKNIKIILI